MEFDLGEFMDTIKERLGFHSVQRVPDLLVPLSSSAKPRVDKRTVKEVAAGTTDPRPDIGTISQLPELKVNPTEFNKRSKN